VLPCRAHQQSERKYFHAGRTSSPNGSTSLQGVPAVRTCLEDGLAGRLGADGASFPQLPLQRHCHRCHHSHESAHRLGISKAAIAAADFSTAVNSRV